MPIIVFQIAKLRMEIDYKDDDEDDEDDDGDDIDDDGDLMLPSMTALS